ncbi:MAG: flippase-like domain-containing protein [Lachnospiraceae bacterium]|nr:flippase-like domain-containing protein [Lachnospiraceae bacterium]
MQKKITYVLNILFMIVVLVFTFYTLLQGEDIQEIFTAMRQAKKIRLFLAVLAAILFLGLQAVSLQIIMKSLGSSVSSLQSVKYNFICFLFNAITPSASGGQPMQIYYMRQDGIPVGASSVALLFWTIIYKVALMVIEGFVFLFHRDFLYQYIGGYYWLFLVGIGVNMVSILLYSIVVFSRNGARSLAYGAAWIFHKLRIIRKKEKMLLKIDQTLEIYQEGAVYMRTHWEVALVVLLVTIVQRVCYFAITWFVCLALGQNTFSAAEIIVLQSFVAVCIDILPFPGGVGVNESFFVTIFKKIMGRKNAFSAMFLSRGVSFYVLLIVSAFVTMVAQVQILKRERHGYQHESI